MSWSPWWPATVKIRAAIDARISALRNQGVRFRDGQPFGTVSTAVARAVRRLDIEKPTEDVLLAIIATIQREDLYP